MREPEGFDDFVRACSSRLYRIGCLLTGGDLPLAEDLVAETFVRVYLAWPRIWEGDAFGYARRTIMNLHIDWWRRRRRRREVLAEVMPERPDGLDHAGRLAQRDSMVRALRLLTRRERAVVILRYYLDLTERETALELGISLGTVKRTNLRALTKLRVSPDLADPGGSPGPPLRAGTSPLSMES